MILHLTDPHFGTERPEVVQGLMALAAMWRPQRIVVSGDITQRARRAQFAAAHRFLNQLCAACGADPRADLLVIPGNHDVPLFHLPLRVLNPYGPYIRWFGADLEPTVAGAGVCLLGVNTTRPWRHKHGELSSAQIARVVERLERCVPDALKVVVTHQPLQVMEADDLKDLVRGHQAAKPAWAAAGADLLLSGHTHQSFVAPLPAPLADTWVVQTGTAVSRRIRERVPNSVHLIRHQGLPHGQRAQVERWDWDGSAAFQQTAETAVPARSGSRAI